MLCERPRRQGVSLLEMLSATAITALLLAGAASFVAFQTRWTTGMQDRMEASVEMALALERLHLELLQASAFLIRTARIVEFLHPDLDGDGIDDVVRWQWEGPGQPLIRRVRYSTGTVNRSDASPPLRSLTFEYEIAGTPGQGSTVELVTAEGTLEASGQPFRRATVLLDRPPTGLP